MGTFIGIDGIRGGWVAVYIDEKKAQRFNYSPELERLLAVSHSRAMIDIPIGLPKWGYRQCDLEAKKLVSSSVFLGARWNVWTFGNYKEANKHYWALGDKGIAKQLWCIRDKLKEVNEAMTQQRQSRLQETHPELVFWHLNNKADNNADLGNKKTDAGRRRRIALLKSHGLDRIEIWLGQRWGTAIGRDDLIDACACALAAREHNGSIPSTPQEDCRGLRMEMWY
jgi:predicted RNase H-like nuclease